MAKPIRLGKAAGEFNVGMSTIVEFLESNGVSIDSTPNTKLTPEQYDMLRAEYAADQVLSEKSKAQSSVVREKRETISLRDKDKPEEKPVVEETPAPAPTPAPVPEPTPEPVAEEEAAPEPVKEEKAPEPAAKEEKAEAVEADDSGVKVKMVGKIDLDSINTKTRPDKSKAEKPKAKEEAKAPAAKKEEAKAEPKKEEPKEAKKEEVKPTETIRAQSAKLGGPKVVGKIELPVERSKSSGGGNSERRKRKRVRKIDVNKQSQGGNNQGGRGKKPRVEKPEITEKDIQKEIKETLARLSNKGGKSKASKNRRAKRDSVAQRRQEEEMAAELEEKILKLTEFVTVSEMATMMNVSSTDVISACMSLGIFASINQRLDAETIHIVAEEFGFETEFVSAEVQESIPIVEDKEDVLP